MWEEKCPVRFFYTATALGQSYASNHSAFLPLFSFEAAGFCGLIHMEVQAKKRVLRCSSIYGRGSPQSPREARVGPQSTAVSFHLRSGMMAVALGSCPLDSSRF